MSRNFSPDFNCYENLGKINVLFLYYKSLEGGSGGCVGDWCYFPHKAILGFPQALWQMDNTVINAHHLRIRE